MVLHLRIFLVSIPSSFFCLQVFKERIEQDEKTTTEHFETIQSSNWMNMRFKPPPPDAPNIGWRVEFRPTEVQLTDFENAAYCAFIVLLTRFYIFSGTILISILYDFGNLCFKGN